MFEGLVILVSSKLARVANVFSHLEFAELYLIMWPSATPDIVTSPKSPKSSAKPGTPVRELNAPSKASVIPYPAIVVGLLLKSANETLDAAQLVPLYLNTCPVEGLPEDTSLKSFNTETPVAGVVQL